MAATIVLSVVVETHEKSLDLSNFRGRSSDDVCVRYVVQAKHAGFRRAA